MVRIRLLAILILVMLTALSRPADPSVANQVQAETWARLGPQGPGAITAIAVAPGWPADHLLLAIRDDGLIRSRDAGATWERLTAPAPVQDGHVHFLGLLPSAQGQPTAFLLVQDPAPQSGSPWRLFRSTDAGTTWTAVHSGPRVAVPPSIVFSPELARDGAIFLVAGGELWRSRNAGVSWQGIVPLSGQRVQQVAISPEFAVDRTVFLAAAVRDRPSSTTVGAERGADHEESSGVAVSTNGGDTWSIASTGLRVDEDPYRNVYDLAVSPTYRQDGTIFAFAAGPIKPLDPALPGASWNGRLFRSTDRGASWEAMPPLAQAQNQGRATVALSPSFAVDGHAFAAVESAGPTSDSAGCTVLGSDNRGRDWGVAIRTGPASGCERVHAIGSGSDFSLLVRRGGQWSATPGGFGERLLERLQEGPSLASPVPYPVLAITPTPDWARDRSAFVGAWGGGVWFYGPDARRTDGRLPCATEVGSGFHLTWEAEAWVHGWLGCAASPERRVRIREAAYAPSRVPNLAASGPGPEPEDYVNWDLRAYWTEDEEPGWFRISQGYWTSHRKGDLPWPAGSYELLEGAVQRFEGGAMFRLFRPNGPGSTLVLVGRDSRGSWRDLPDRTDRPAMPATPAILPTIVVSAPPAGLPDAPVPAPPPNLPDRSAVPATPATLPDRFAVPATPAVLPPAPGL
jgi:hypothetical protein